MNSLFQYYFTIKPLREAVLNYNDHAEGDLTDEELKAKQISNGELNRSKRCNLANRVTDLVIEQLRVLFQELIASDRAYITPKEDLIRLTLIDAKQDVEQERRQSAGERPPDDDLPDLIELDTEIPPPAPASSPALISLEDDDVPPETDSLMLEPTSGQDIPLEDADYEFVDREPEHMDVDESHTTPPTAPKTEDDDHLEEVHMVATPPIIPKRRMRRRSTWQPLKYGSQQDVTECVTNCLSQLHAGFKLEETLPNGDKIDLFKRYAPGWKVLMQVVLLACEGGVSGFACPTDGEAD
jgi:ubiquitin carboxyl-terminal hydrolase 25